MKNINMQKSSWNLDPVTGQRAHHPSRSKSFFNFIGSKYTRPAELQAVRLSRSVIKTLTGTITNSVFITPKTARQSKKCVSALIHAKPRSLNSLLRCTTKLPTTGSTVGQWAWSSQEWTADKGYVFSDGS